MTNTTRRPRRSTFGSVNQQPSGHWRARYTGPDGREHSRTFDTRKDAEAWRAVEHVSTQGRQWAPPAAVEAARIAQVSTRFDEYAQEVLDRRLANGKNRETTNRLYERFLRLYVLPTFGTCTLAEITPRMVSNWHASLARKPAARGNSYGVMAMIMHEAERDELIDRTPCRVAGGGSKRTVRTTDDEVLNPVQFAEYIAHVPDRNGYRMLLKVAFWCGLRSGELRGLRRCDIDLKAQELTVAQQVVKLDGRNVISPWVKTDAGYRTIAVPPHLVAELRDWLAELPVMGKGALLVHSPTGLPMSGEALRAAAKVAAEAIGRPNLRVHSLRHSSATLAAQNGATTSELMGRFGWATPDMAARYCHSTKDRDRSLAARLSALA